MAAAANGTKKLASKLVAIQAAAKQVDKTGRMAHGNVKYDFMQEHGLLGLLGPLFEEHKVFVAGSIAPNSVEHVGDKCYLEYELIVLDGDTGEQMVFRGAGEGQDRGDKATAKAMTMANKYCLQKVFQVATENIDDADNTSSAQLEQEAKAAAAAAEASQEEETSQPKTGPRAKPSARKLDNLYKTARDAVRNDDISLSADRVKAVLQAQFGVEEVKELKTNEDADQFATWLTEELRGSAAAKA